MSRAQMVGATMTNAAHLSEWEDIAYRAICAAAEAGEVCPTNGMLGFMVGANADENVGSKLVARLELKGLIGVKRIQNKFRRVQIIASGKWTERHPGQHCDDDGHPHVPRGCRIVGTPIIVEGGRYKIGK